MQYYTYLQPSNSIRLEYVVCAALQLVRVTQNENPQPDGVTRRRFFSARGNSMELTKLPLFRHRPLDLAEREIRLLKLQSRGRGPYLRLSISHHYFEEAHCPRYWALSYTWGSSKSPYCVEIDGRPFYVSENLYTLLRAIEHGAPRNLEYPFTRDFELEGMHFWVDQICIDQHSTREKNHQVAMMKSIYIRAASTVIWLGPRHRIPACSETLEAMMNEKYTHPTRRELQTLRDFLSQPYWTRLWVVQEIMCSRNILILCGVVGLLWEDFTRYCNLAFGIDPTGLHEQYYYRSKDVPKELEYIRSLICQKEELYTSRGDDLSYVIQTFGALKCADARDKVFGLLGLVKIEARVSVDYRLSRKELLHKVMAKVVHDERHRSKTAHEEFARTLWDLLHDVDRSCSNSHRKHTATRLYGSVWPSRVERNIRILRHPLDGRH